MYFYIESLVLYCMYLFWFGI